MRSSPTPVEDWGFAGILTAVDRGGLSQWRRIGTAIRNARKTNKQLLGEKFTSLLQEAEMTQAEAAAFLGTSRRELFA